MFLSLRVDHLSCRRRLQASICLLAPFSSENNINKDLKITYRILTYVFRKDTAVKRAS
jgi:hypothetical protein